MFEGHTVRSFRDLSALKLASLWCTEQDFVQLRKVSKDSASKCSMLGTSQGWWHCNGSDDVPNVRPDHLRTAFTVALVRAPMCMVVVSCAQSPFPHMCCQLPAKPTLHFRLVGRPFGHHVGECWCVTAGLLVHNLSGQLTWTISTCCWQLRLSSDSVTCLLKHLWTVSCVNDTAAYLVRLLVHLDRCCRVGEKDARTACTHQIFPLRACF